LLKGTAAPLTISFNDKQLYPHLKDILVIKDGRVRVYHLAFSAVFSMQRLPRIEIRERDGRNRPVLYLGVHFFLLGKNGRVTSIYPRSMTFKEDEIRVIEGTRWTKRTNNDESGSCDAVHVYDATK